MKKFIYVFGIIIILTVVILAIYNSSNNKLLVKDKNIKKITISIDGGDKLIKTTENISEIADIVKHMNGLHLKRTHTDVNEYTGTAFVITLYYGNQPSREYVEYGNMFIKESGKGWYRISYKEAEKFEEFYNKLGDK